MLNPHLNLISNPNLYLTKFDKYQFSRFLGLFKVCTRVSFLPSGLGLGF